MNSKSPAINVSNEARQIAGKVQRLFRENLGGLETVEKKAMEIEGDMRDLLVLVCNKATSVEIKIPHLSVEEVPGSLVILTSKSDFSRFLETTCPQFIQALHLPSLCGQKLMGIACFERTISSFCVPCVTREIRKSFS